MKNLFKLFTALVVSFLVITGANAKTVQVTALEDWDAANPPQVLHVQMNANTRLDYDLMLFQGFQVTGNVVKTNNGFAFIPVNYVNYQEEQLPIDKQYPAVIKAKSGIIRQNQPFGLVFPNYGPDNFQYYVPSVSDMN